MITNALADLINRIADRRMPGVFNPWCQSDPLDIDGLGPVNRRIRLAEHFDCRPKYLLIGEAPGYQGAHFSGIAFTNEALLMAGLVPRVARTERITTRERPWSEPSATIVWRELHELGIAESTVMWNAFPWHPHHALETLTNRTPTTAELLAGADVLRAVLRHFPIALYIAVGRLAKLALETAGVNVFATVRHPSMGGATMFRAQMKALGAGRAA